MKLVAEARIPEPPAAIAYRGLVEAELHRLLDDARCGVEEAAPTATVLVDELVRTVQAGGKRIRPLFCYWGYRAGGAADAAAAARAGAAVELLHTAAIVHDDVIDESLVRRGRPSAFSALGRAGAILAGDLAQALADQALAASDLPPGRVATAFGPFNEMRILAIAGEFLDVAAAGAPAGAAEPDERAVRRAGALKSGSYTVVGPLRVGAALAGAGPEVVAWLDAYGHPLGEAFQIRDDVLGTFGVPALTGKDRDGDIRTGRRTVLIAKARRLAGRADRRLLDERLGRPDLTAEQVEEVRAVLTSSGALAETLALIEELAGAAKTALDGIPVEADVRIALEGLADLVALRDG